MRSKKLRKLWKIIYTKDITFSSSNLINKYFNFQSNEQKILIDKIKRKNNFLKIKNLVDGFSKLKVLVIGEVIIDKYVFCEALGKSGKEPMLVLRNIKTEKYLGDLLLFLNIYLNLQRKSLYTE